LSEQQARFLLFFTISLHDVLLLVTGETVGRLKLLALTSNLFFVTFWLTIFVS